MPPIDSGSCVQPITPESLFLNSVHQSCLTVADPAGFVDFAVTVQSLFPVQQSLVATAAVIVPVAPVHHPEPEHESGCFEFARFAFAVQSAVHFCLVAQSVQPFAAFVVAAFQLGF